MASPSAPVAAPPAAPAASTPAPATPSVTPAAPVTPEAPPAAPATPAGPPKNTDFPDTADGQVRFLAELKKFENAQKAAPAIDAAKTIADNLGAQPGEKPAEAKPAEPADKPAEKPAEAKPEGEQKPADQPVLPKQLADLLDAKPERKAFLEADPELKAAVFSTARRLAAAEPVLELVPTRADAEFMQEHTAALVGMKTASMRMIDMPETAPQVLDMLDQQFAIVDKDGKPVLGQDGKPTYAEDRRPFLNAIVQREVDAYKQQFKTEKAALQAKLAGHYPNEAAKAADQTRFDRLELAEAWADMWDQVRTGEIFKMEAPEIPADATPEFKAWAEAEKKRLGDEAAEIDKKKNGASKEARQAERATFNASVRSDMGGIAGKVIGAEINSLIEAGVYIPEFYLQEKHVDPATGQPTKTSAIIARVFMAFENELMRPGSRTLMEITNHELLPANEQTRQVRKDYYQRKAAELIPGLVSKEKARIEELVKADQKKIGDQLEKRRGATQQEPATAGNGNMSGQTDNQLMQQAEENAKKVAGWTEANPGDKQARILTEFHKLTASRR
jgi:hypothetical protein